MVLVETASACDDSHHRTHAFSPVYRRCHRPRSLKMFMNRDTSVMDIGEQFDAKIGS
jgi:hypothetical protein